MSFEVVEERDFLEGGKSLKVVARPNALAVYGGPWKLLLDRGMQRVTWLLVEGLLSGKEIGVFFQLVGQMGPANTVAVSQKALATELEVSVSYVSRVLRKLADLGLVRGGMASPEVVYRGRTEDYPAVLEAWQRWQHQVADAPLAFGNLTGDKA